MIPKEKMLELAKTFLNDLSVDEIKASGLSFVLLPSEVLLIILLSSIIAIIMNKLQKLEDAPVEQMQLI